MTARVFIDGAHGTTGLEIRERLGERRDIALIVLDEAERRDPAARERALKGADFAILCLPDDAAREAVALTGDAPVRFIDASTAHRTDPAWVYGFPEFAAGQRAAIASARYVSNPGCYSTGFLALVAPLVAAGVLDAATPFTVNAVSGYSGGGKAMIAEFEGGGEDTAFRAYAMGLQHKHVPEMQERAGLSRAPLFAPAVVRTYRGMVVEVPLVDSPPVTVLHEALDSFYRDAALVSVVHGDQADIVRIEENAGSDRMTLRVFGNDDRRQARLVATLDNLGKGASGAAVQSLNIMAGLEETAGLRL
ncbi:N-acetyl-gamma-glutamyl-phosphate reductase [Sphingomonas gilva]|uniref:N-acetyl-gamma-glutamyl-phosphate reductase n=1 Tax=Sphingomonas gilva TaxID=2305907 RepID=A0A396RQ79_9SPHN|nr:N-acetyl-gamma-glutamyl-phosphate reductase [Sphingomonas gilva]RHW16433.1 N-acetyl-gamma-glutamyl-phosphate reductase [Sphingomonas gilva]